MRSPIQVNLTQSVVGHGGPSDSASFLHLNKQPWIISTTCLPLCILYTPIALEVQQESGYRGSVRGTTDWAAGRADGRRIRKGGRTNGATITDDTVFEGGNGVCIAGAFAVSPLSDVLSCSRRSQGWDSPNDVKSRSERATVCRPLPTQPCRTQTPHSPGRSPPSTNL